MGTVTEKIVFIASDGSQHDSRTAANIRNQKINQAKILFTWMEENCYSNNLRTEEHFIKTYLNNPINGLNIHLKK